MDELDTQRSTHILGPCKRNFVCIPHGPFKSKRPPDWDCHIVEASYMYLVVSNFARCDGTNCIFNNSTLGQICVADGGDNLHVREMEVEDTYDVCIP